MYVCVCLCVCVGGSSCECGHSLMCLWGDVCLLCVCVCVCEGWGIHGCWCEGGGVSVGKFVCLEG